MTTVAQWITQLGAASAHPAALLIVVLFTISWIVFQPETLDWHGVATIATWVMTLFIQRTEHRDTQAIQAKLDELLRAQAGADSRLTRLDEREAEEIEDHRDAARSTD
jgi:low affinity Fe/Cu permease